MVTVKAMNRLSARVFNCADTNTFSSHLSQTWLIYK